jgi:hypothetical protein
MEAVRTFGNSKTRFDGSGLSTDLAEKLRGPIEIMIEDGSE